MPDAGNFCILCGRKAEPNFSIMEKIRWFPPIESVTMTLKSESLSSGMTTDGMVLSFVFV